MTTGINPNQIKASLGGGNFTSLQSILDQYIIKTVGFPVGNLTSRQTFTLGGSVYYVDVGSGFSGFKASPVEGFRLASSGGNNTPVYLGDDSNNSVSFASGYSSAVIAPIYNAGDAEGGTTSIRTILLSTHQPVLVNLCDIRDASTHSPIQTIGGAKVWGLLVHSANTYSAGTTANMGNNLYLYFMTFDSSEFASTYQLPAGTYDFTYNVITQKKLENASYVWGG